MRRYPFAAIAPLVADMTAAEVAAILGVTRAAVQGWRSRGSTITEDQADKLATHLAVHPSQIWADWYDDLSAVCAEVECSEVIVPRPLQRFCSDRCRDRDRYKRNKRKRYQAQWEREKYQRDAEAREAKKAASKLYWEIAGRRGRARRRAAA